MPPQAELAQIQLDINKIDKSEPTFIGPYYNSTLPKGNNRLADIIIESSFYTKNLSKKSAKVFLMGIILGLCLLLIIIYFLFNMGIDQIKGKLFAKCMSLVIVFLISGDLIFLWRRYMCLSTESENIFNKSSILKGKSKVSLEEIIDVINDYNCALMQSPPIPGIIYEKMKKSLYKAWDK